MYLVVKRFFDFLFALLLLIPLAPLLLPIIIGLIFTGEGHVFYFQKRIGLKNKDFYIWKFATMVKNSMNLGTGSITIRNDPRITPMGGFLRKTKINELPQIINVLKGDISIVGPRPLVQKTFDAYTKEIQNKIYNLKPGITGIGSIVFRDEEKIISASDIDPHEFYQTEIAPYKAELEIWYQNNISFFTDLKIIILTAWTIFNSNSKLHFKWFKDLPKK